jgi:DNA ligase-4
MRILLPQCDSERGKYGIKQMSIAKLYINILNLSPTSEDAKHILNWHDPKRSGNADFGCALEDILKTRVQSDYSHVTIGDINSILDDIANAFGKEKDAIVRNRIVMKLNANEQKWLMRIIFEDLRIGLKKESVLKKFYPGALDRYDECSSLRIICQEQLTQGNKLYGMVPFDIYSPMLALKPGSSQLRFAEEKMDGHPFYMDIKLDGERMACHTDGEHVLFATRYDVWLSYLFM